MKQVWAAVLPLVVFLDSLIRVATAPLCARGEAGCQAPSLADLFDRVIQQSARMHGISSDLHSEFEQYVVFPSRNQIRQRRCPTYGILTPADKENTQRLGRAELTEVILRLLGAWGEPLSQFHHSISLDEDQDFNHYNSDKALEMSNMMQELRTGVAKVVERMHLLGVISNTLTDGFSPESLLPPSSSSSSYEGGEHNSMEHHNLLYCFRRDSYKVQSYLRILKCTIPSEPDC